MDQISPETVAEFPERGMQWVKDRVSSTIPAIKIRDPEAGKPVMLQSIDSGKELMIVLAHTLARAVYSMLTRDPVFEMDTCLNGSGSRAGQPAASLDTHGISLHERP